MRGDVAEAWEGDEEDLYEHFRFEAEPGQKLLRVDKFLFNFMTHTSRNRIQKAAEAGAIRVNAQPVKSNYRVKPGDVVTLVLAQPPKQIELFAQDLDLDVVYKDSDVVIVNKSAGMVVHPSYGHYSDTLINGLLHLFEQLPDGDKSERPGLVHRIDKDTSGLLVIARNEYAMAFLAKQFADHTTEREYLAIALGNIEEDRGTITGHIGRSLKDRKVMAVFEDGKYGKHAVTHYEVKERFGFATLVACRLETGRTHQIRAHFKHIGHPLFADETYGGTDMPVKHGWPKFKEFMLNNLDLCPRQALHARMLGFEHPTKKGERLRFEAALPEDMEAILERFRNYVAAHLA
jgi:23S rRNA pseudouridine1911/1915/1917 synthase